MNIQQQRASEISYIDFGDGSDEGIYTCNNCGAYHSDAAKIVHHATCRKGEASYWVNFYAKED